MTPEKAVASDIDQLVELRLAYLAEDNGGLSREDEARIRRDLPGYFAERLNDDLLAFVARQGSVIVACALLLLVDKPMSPAFINGRTGAVLNVYTRPEHRGEGCASSLMKLLMAEAAGRELSVVELKATDMGRSLYRSLGFEDERTPYHRMTWNGCRRHPVGDAGPKSPIAPDSGSGD